MRLSQAQFAEAVRAAGNAMGVPNHCTKRLVQKWETGEHAACRPDYLRVLQAVTGLSALDLGFRILPDESGEAIAGSDEAAEGAAAGSPDADVPRPGVRALSMSGMPQYDADASVEASLHRLRHALEHPSRADFRTAEFVEAATARLFELEHHSPARLLAPTVDRHLAQATGLLTAANHDGVRRSLMASSGRTALLAGWLAFDRGDTASANRYWDAAIGAAEITRNEALLAASLTFQSYAAARREDPGAAWQLAHSAMRVQRDARAAVWATTRVALYAAQLGEWGTAEQAMQQAMEIGGTLRDPRPGDRTAPWLRSFDRASLLSSIAHTAALMKSVDAPAHAAQAVESLSEAKVKSRAIVLAECALVAAISGEFDLCLDWGSAAARLARELDVSLAADLLYEIVPIVLPYSDTRTVRELMPHLALLRRSADLIDQAE
jgi:hypothetical protein